ncbi:MAG TPA: 4-(cytidine 5'-diphospho)-2-C-methyl-D-erythritol kinase [Marmoricola sp.]|nr:4-(cytidine 5'-diphospho)-2-C-methyl-D-erythritol kinase [Marmoricola sp.]HNO40249.1 4-(cytidine 5'-diphospho)-2-C-methyl-D-erythritol kinase [Marmoricola sp.]
MSLAQEWQPAITVRAAAKVNLTLQVGPARPDGFHPLDTIYQAIGLYDDLTAVTAPDWSVEVTQIGQAEEALHIDLGSVPTGDDNIVIRAGKALAAHHDLDLAAAFSIAKGIPVAAGMAGGSADAAAALVALDRLWELETSDQDLLHLAAGLGSDVPFALIGGTAHGTGRGELVEPMVASATQWFVIVPSLTGGLSTPAVYAEYDRGEVHGIEPPLALLEALQNGDPLTQAMLRNDLTEPALRLKPELADLIALGERLGARASLLSGSGPTLLFLADDQNQAMELRADFIANGVHQALAAPGPVAGAHVVDYA